MAAANHSSHRSGLFSPVLQVYLYDWWLIKSEAGVGGKQLGVGGFVCRRGQGVKLFRSTAIAKRHDAVTLQTMDGMTILVSGFINKSRTFQNGFSSEVCNQFLLGFPYNWEEFAAPSFGEPTNEDAAFGMSGFSEIVKAIADGTSSSSMSFDHLPAHFARDILISSFGDSEGDMLRKSIWGEMVYKYRSNAYDTGEASCLDGQSSDQGTDTDISLDVTPSRRKKAKADQKLEDRYHRPDGNSGKKEFQKATREEGMPIKERVLRKMQDTSGGTASIIIENSNQVTSRGDETPNQKKKATSNLGEEDENHVPDGQSRKEVFQKSGDMNSGPLTRGKASIYKKAAVNQKQQGRDVHNAEFGRGDFSGPLTRSKARKHSIS